ncbi:MAG TPA: polysaccharide biosynthesis C-terminal domain-containing protein [Candidatus Babeliales bacterium]|nr:polysaccharide biosynthesis C-terminal domain-containing protein [Candidatus Babeliales bacterium]
MLPQSKLLKNFSIYALGAVIARLITASGTLATVTILTPAQFGLLALFNSCLVMVPALLNLGLRQVFGLEFFHLPDRAARLKLLNELLLLYLLLTLPILLISLGHLNWLNQALFLNQTTEFTIALVLVSCWLSWFNELFYQLLRYQQRAHLLTTLQLASAGLTAGLTWSLVFRLNWGVLGCVSANLAGLSLGCGYAAYRYYRTVQQQRLVNSNSTMLPSGPPSRAKLSTLIWARRSLPARRLMTLTPQQAANYLKLGAPYVLSTLCAWVLATSDRWLLARWGNLELVGIYALADSFGQLFNLAILNPVAYSYVPHLLSRFSAQRHAPAQLQQLNHQNFRYMYLAMGGLLLLTLVGFSLLKPLFYWLAPLKYQTAINYVPLILTGQICLLGTYFATGWLQFRKQVYLQVGLTIGAAVVNVLLNLLLTPRWQLYGCTLATALAYALYLWAAIYVTQRQINKLDQTN